MQQNSLVYCFLIVLTLLPEQGVKFVWSAGVDTTADVIEIEGAESGVIHGKGYGYGYGRKRYAHPKFHYNYGVNNKLTGDFKTAYEERDGPITKGSYSVLQSDGVLRTVNYIVDPVGGFQAKVINKGLSAHHGGVAYVNNPGGVGVGYLVPGYHGYGKGEGLHGGVGYHNHLYG